MEVPLALEKTKQTEAPEGATYLSDVVALRKRLHAERHDCELIASRHFAGRVPSPELAGSRFPGQGSGSN
jgi:hypothetical protein